MTYQRTMKLSGQITHLCGLIWSYTLRIWHLKIATFDTISVYWRIHYWYHMLLSKTVDKNYSLKVQIPFFLYCALNVKTCTNDRQQEFKCLWCSSVVLNLYWFSFFDMLLWVNFSGNLILFRTVISGSRLWLHCTELNYIWGIYWNDNKC